MGNNVLCPPVFDQRHAQGLKGLFRKLRRRTHGDLFVGIAEFFAHADPDVPQAGLCKGPAQAGHAVLSAHQGKHPGIGADIRHNIVLSTMNTDGNHIFIRGPQPRTEIGKRTEARKHLHLRIFEFRQKLLCPAEKSHIPGHHHGEAAVFPVGGNMRGDGLRIDGVKNRLSGAGHRLGHAFGADDAVCLFDGGPDFTGHGGPAAGADAHHRHPGLPVQAEAPAHQLQRVGKAAALPLGGAADDHKHRARGTGGGRLFRKTAPAAALLGDQVRGRHRFEHSHIHFHRKRPLHGENMGRGKPGFPAQPQGFLHGQHPGIDPLPEVPDGGVAGQLLAAGGQQDVAPGGVEIVHRAAGVGDKNRVLRGGVFLPQQAQIFRPGVPTGPGNVFGDLRGVGMGGVHHQVKALPLHHGPHFLPGHAFGGNRQVVRRGQQRLAVFRGHAGGHRHRLPREKLHQRTALGGSGKHTELRHPGTLWV